MPQPSDLAPLGAFVMATKFSPVVQLMGVVAHFAHKLRCDEDHLADVTLQRAEVAVSVLKLDARTGLVAALLRKSSCALVLLNFASLVICPDNFHAMAC